MKKKITVLIAILLMFILTSISEKVYSYPRFAAYSGDMCVDCHVNPTGGGMRNGGGLKFAENKLSMEMFQKLAGKTQFSPKITKDITLGGDVRVAQVDNEVSEDVSNYNSFLTMQGDIYFNAQLNKILNVYVTSGIQIPNLDTKYEVFGMIANLPANIYFKAGRFKPSFGTRIVEHRAYQRSNLLYTPYDANTGFELGINPDWFDMNIGLYNISRPGYNEFYGSDPHKMFIGNTNVNFAFKKLDFNVNVGASFLNDPYNVSDSTFTSTITNLKQAYGGNTRLGFFQRVALIGEADFEENKSDYPLRRSFYGFAELDIIIIKGLELRSQYEIYDFDRDVSDDDVQRISAGFAAYPFFGFETEVMVRFVSEEPEIQNNEFQWNFHFYF